MDTQAAASGRLPDGDRRMAGSPYPPDGPGGGDRIVVDGGRTRGRVAAVLRRLPAGAVVPHRRHGTEDLVYVVLHGEVALDERVCGPGSVLHVPPGRLHRYRALTDAQLLVVAAPAGVEQLLLHEERLASDDPALLLVLAQEHHVEVLPGLLP